VFENAPEIVERELKRHYDVEDVELCFTTDPYMHGHESIYKISNMLIEVLRKYNAGVTVLTKGDLGLAIDMPGVKYGVSLVSLSDDFQRKWEPGTASYGERIAALKAKHEAGLPTWVSIEPFPAAESAENSVLELIDNLSFVDKAVLGRWNYAGVRQKEYYYKVAMDFGWACKQYGIEYLIKSDIRNGVEAEAGVIK
jgi:DNA repair photolyase